MPTGALVQPRGARLTGANVAAAWEIVYAAIERLGADFDKTLDQREPERGIQPQLALRLFNSRPGTTTADLIGLLEEARDRIRAELRRKPK